MTTLSTFTTDTNPTEPAAPGRPSGLTAWLVLLIVYNVIAAVVLPVIGAAVRSLSPPQPASDAVLFAPTVLAVVNIACVVALFKYKKWGFWGLCATAVALIPVLQQLGGGGQAGLLAGIIEAIGLGILYALLQSGKADQKTWPRLR